jgi:hypothetical protein
MAPRTVLLHRADGVLGELRLIAGDVDGVAGRQALPWSFRRSLAVLTTSTVLVPLCLRTLRMTVARYGP